MELLYRLDPRFSVWQDERGSLILKTYDPLQKKEFVVELNGDIRYFVKSLVNRLNED